MSGVWFTGTHAQGWSPLVLEKKLLKKEWLRNIMGNPSQQSHSSFTEATGSSRIDWLNPLPISLELLHFPIFPSSHLAILFTGVP